MLTKRQKEIKDFINKAIVRKNIAPTEREIAAKFRISPSTVHEHLEALQEKGYLEKAHGRARGIKISDSLSGLIKIPLLGYIAAGQPIEAIEDRTQMIAFPTNRVPATASLFALTVQGDSMIDENIYDGDVIVVKEQNTAKNGETVVALIDNEGATVKKFYREFRQIRLQPANDSFEPLIIKKHQDLKIQGVVVDVIRDNNTPSFGTLAQKTKRRLINRSSAYFSTENISIYNNDILKLNSISNNSVDLIITSPPYNVDIHYNSHADNLSYDDYLEFSRLWMQKCFDLAKNEGRFLLNVPLDKNKGGQKSVGADFTRIAKEIGWKYHSTIIWNEGNISRRTAWGSFMSASAPYVIAPVELILVLYKENWKKTGGSRENDITRQEFMDWTNGVWTFNGQSKKGAGGHPAPFPIELPRRCIKLFSFVGDTVLDPFLGSGSTLIAAAQQRRIGLGVEIDKKYCDIAILRLKKEAGFD